MCFISCRTTKVIEIVYVPEINPPEFPELGDYERKDGKVIADEDYFRELLIFRTKYFDMIAKYEEIRKLYEREVSK